jgi:hypothetical protein
MSDRVVYVTYWTDEDDLDPSTNSGFEEHGSEDALLKWLNDMVQVRPKTSPETYQVLRPVSFKAEQVATRYSISN